jgi:6-pyruvoyl-tetrahydropterin synthase
MRDKPCDPPCPEVLCRYWAAFGMCFADSSGESGTEGGGCAESIESPDAIHMPMETTDSSTGSAAGDRAQVSDMKGSWPKVTASLRFDCEAIHAMIRLGGECAKPHVHRYEITFGWTHEIQPRQGYTHERSEQHAKFTKIIQRIQGADLNNLLPMQPSAEVLALWALAQLEPAYCDHVIVRCYDGYEVRADRQRQRGEWMQFLAGRGPDPFSNETFTLK